MQVVFANKELATCAGNKGFAVKKLGQRRADIYWSRLETLRQSTDVNSLKTMPGRFHELTGNRSGQWACDLDHPYRLIFKPLINSEGNVVGLVVEQTISILEIVDYHK